MKKINILIDGAGTATAISIIKGLRLQSEFDVKIVTDDMSDFVAGNYLSDKFYPVPAAGSDDFIPTIIDICKKEEISVFFPIIEYGYNNIVKNKKLLEEQGVTVILGTEETIRLTENKYRTYQFFVENNITTPKTYLPADIPENIEFPVFIKPNTMGRASIDAFKIESKEDLDFYLKKLNDPIIQEYIEGKEFTADCLNTLEGNELIDCVVRSRIETKGGLAVKANIIKPPVADKIKEYIKQIVSKVTLPGVCNIQGFITKNDEIVIVEINPRFAGTHALSVAVGLNTAYHILQMHKGRSAEEIRKDIKINYNIKMVRYWEEIMINNDKAFNPWEFWNK